MCRNIRPLHNYEPASTDQDAHDAALSNAVSVVEKMAAHQNEDLFIDTPGAVWTELTNAPGWWKVEIPDEEYAAALAEPQLWAILEATELAGPWTDTGRREPGNGASVQQLLRDQVRYEGPQASHDFGPMRFYRRVLPSEVPPPLEEK